MLRNKISMKLKSCRNDKGGKVRNKKLRLCREENSLNRLNSRYSFSPVAYRFYVAIHSFKNTIDMHIGRPKWASLSLFNAAQLSPQILSCCYAGEMFLRVLAEVSQPRLIFCLYYNISITICGVNSCLVIISNISRRNENKEAFDNNYIIASKHCIWTC